MLPDPSFYAACIGASFDEFAETKPVRSSRKAAAG
jgi:hypothetical protein